MITDLLKMKLLNKKKGTLLIFGIATVLIILSLLPKEKDVVFAISKEVSVHYSYSESLMPYRDSQYNKSIQLINKNTGAVSNEIEITSQTKELKTYVVKSDKKVLYAVQDDFVCTYLFDVSTLEQVPFNQSCDETIDVIVADMFKNYSIDTLKTFPLKLGDSHQLKKEFKPLKTWWQSKLGDSHQIKSRSRRIK